jgi:predicted RND superfamily exporter protein
MSEINHSKKTSFEVPPSANQFFYRWAQWIVNARWLVIILSLCSVLLSILLIVPYEKLPKEWAEHRHEWLGHRGLLVDTSVEAFSNPKDKGQLVLEAYRDEFGRDDFFMLMVEGDVFSVPFLQKLQKLHLDLEALNIEVDSLGERKSDRIKKVRGVDSLKAFEALKAKHKQHTIEDSSDQNNDLDQLEDFGDFGQADEQGWGDESGGSIIEEVTSLINARKTYGTKDGLVVGEWCDPMPTTDQMEDFKKEVLADKTLLGQVVGHRGQHAVILLRANFMSEDDSIKVNQAIKKVAAQYNDSQHGFKVYSSGLPQLNSTLKTTLLSTLKVLLILSIIVMLCVLVFQFRHILGVIPPMIVVALATQNMFAIMAITGMPVTMLSNILPAFIFCVGIGDSVHLLSVYRDYFRKHQDSSRAVIETVSTTAIPILFTSLTTMVGLLSFRFASIPAIQEMGTAGAIGVGAACLHSLLFLPAVLTFNRKGRLGLPPLDLDTTNKDKALLIEHREDLNTLVDDEIHTHNKQSPNHSLIPENNSQLLTNQTIHTTIKAKDWLDRFIYFLADGTAGLTDDGHARPESAKERKRRIRTLWIGAILTVIACWGVSLLKVWHNPLSWLPKTNSTKISFDVMDREVGGTANIQFLITGGDKGIKDLSLLKGLEQLEKYVQAYVHPTEGKIIGNAMSVNDIVKETRQALKAGNPQDYHLPKNEKELAQLLFLFENTGPDQLRRLASNDLQKSQMTIRLKWLEATSYLDLTQYIEKGIKKFIPQHVKVEATGSVYTLVSTIGSLLLDLIKSFGAALVVITLIMMLLLRGIKLGLIAMIPNLMPILWLMGMMGFVGIPVDMNNILIASIAIGLAVDDTIHFLHHYRVHYEKEHDSYSAIHHALNHAGRAMVSTSLILTLGFFAYMAADMVNIRTFGLLIGLSALTAMLIDLIFAPAILRTVYDRSINFKKKPHEIVSK